jgi:hypothetical protein
MRVNPNGNEQHIEHKLDITLTNCAKKAYRGSGVATAPSRLEHLCQECCHTDTSTAFS